jgi:hypothetical protein
VRAVHDLDDFPIDSPRHDAIFAPAALLVLWCSFRELELPILLPELRERSLGHIAGYFLFASPFLRDAGLTGQSPHLGLVFYLVITLAFSGHEERMGDVPPMVRMGGRTGCNHPGEVPGGDDIGGSAADAPSGTFAEWIDAARPHGANATANAQLPETALGLHGIVSVEGQFDAYARRNIDHVTGCWIYTALLVVHSFGISFL